MQRISGLPDARVLAFEAQIEAAMTLALQQVADKIADQIEALSKVLVAAVGDEVPPGDGLPPGQPYVSPDDLASITPLWEQAAAQSLLPVVAQIWQASSGQVYSGLVEASGIAALPSVGSLAAEQYLAQAKATFDQVGDALWVNARNALLDGFERGESIPQLAERIRGAAPVTARTATLVARTQVIEASNAGSITTARISGIQMLKEWLATPDLRTRPSHLAADGQRVPLTDPFIVGGYSADFPAAPSLPPAERYSCRCTLGYIISDSAVDDARTRVEQIAAEQTAQVEQVFGEVHAEFETLGLPPIAARSTRTHPSLPGRAPEADEFGNLREGGRWFDDDGGHLTNAYVDRFGLPSTQLSFGWDSTGSYSVVKSTRGTYHIARQSDGGPDDALFTRGVDDVKITDLDDAALRSFADDLDRALTPPAEIINAETGELISEKFAEPFVSQSTGLRLTPSRDGVDISGLAKGNIFLETGDAGSLADSLREMARGATGRALPHPSLHIVPAFVAPTPAVEAAAIRAPLLRAKTVKGLQTAIRGEYQRITGRDILVLVPDDASLPTWRQWAEGVLRGTERFPEANAGAQAIRFSRIWGSVDRRAALLRSTRGDVSGWAEGRNGWSVRGAGNPTATAVHEYGHLLDIDNLGSRIHSQALTAVRRRAALEGLADDDLVAREISIYATSDEFELVAEAFADVILRGDAASALSREIFGLLETEYRKAGFAIRTAPPVRFPARAAAAGLNAKTVPQLRALASERGIVVPAGVRKADLVRLLSEEVPAPPAPAIAAPEQMHIKAVLDQTYDYYDAETGLTARVVSVAGRDPGRTTHVSITITDRSGKEAGSALRTIDPADRATVTHGHLGLDPEVQGKGFATRYNAHVEQSYREHGIQRIETHAGGGGDASGSYTWARAGYDFATPAARQGVARTARAFAEHHELPASVRVEIEQVASNPTATPNDFAMIGHKAGAKTWPGREILLSDTAGWDGVKILAPAVETFPARAAAAGLNAKTVPQLRALASERGIVVPPGIRRPALVKLLEEVPAPRVLTPEQIQRAAARETNRLIEASTSTARLLAEVDELIAKKATKAAIRERLDPALAAPEQIFAGADPDIIKSLADALATGDAAKLRSALTRAGTKAKIKVIGGKAGAKVKFDPETMEGFTEAEIKSGTQVIVVRRGSTLTLPDGKVLQLEKAKVTIVPTKAVGVPKFAGPKPPPAEMARAKKLIADKKSRALYPWDLDDLRGAFGLDQAQRKWLEGFARRNPETFMRLVQDQRMKEQYAEWRAQFEVRGTATEVRGKMVDEMRDQLSDAPIMVRRQRESSLRDILERGRMRTQFETGTSSGSLAPDLRARFEQMSWGYPTDLDPALRPVYGYLAAGPDSVSDAVGQYGSIRIRLKESVRSRTSFTVADSLGGWKAVAPSPITSPTWESFNITPFEGWRAPGPLGRDYGSKEFRRENYVEAQIHGGVAVDDIEEVIFGGQPEATTIAALERAGISWRIE